MELKTVDYFHKADYYFISLDKRNSSDELTNISAFIN